MSTDYANILRLSYSHLYDLSPPAPRAPGRDRMGKVRLLGRTKTYNLYSAIVGARGRISLLLSAYIRA